MTVDTPPDILARLRRDTRAEHDAIERVLDLVGEGLTRASYRRVLERFHGYYAPLEDRLGALGAFTGPGPARKTALLAADLVALGVPAPERLPRCEALPDLAGPAEVLGCLYVLEGATLGGQVIARHVARALGVGPAGGGGFFHGHGAETGPRWRAFCATLAAFGADARQHDAMVRAALDTFRTLRLWCVEPSS